MNKPQSIAHTIKTNPTAETPSKAPWHCPTIIFVPLQTTANFSGSSFDGLTVTGDPK